MAVQSNYHQDPPNSIQIELAEGCNLACSFCGIQSIRENEADGPENIHMVKPLLPTDILTIERARSICDSYKRSRMEPTA
jgi:MoaA/NifB/PqqE/SkfB family radical SAM enzyme